MKGKANAFKILSCLFLCLILAASALGCLGSREYVVEGKIMTESGTQPFDNSKIYIELVDITDSEKNVVLEQMVLENGSKNNYKYTLTHENKLNPKGIYTVTAHIDMDGDGKISRGDYMSKPMFRLEANMIEQPFDIYVYLNE
ncbi:hypothetical protein MmiEs2_04070 [Methanimicrococcus stummii]|uniref:Uncharacterized protein n=1 Tax=Methanimicrococcus stummii TaxID=3028294 RepID=A0AA97A7M4_9EURY|nr:YbaY family lipoprotein [Methanimicrococcus sp. Es2]WNY28223.1 hypothetical protein MmiEs2_04070 [Methanimicrococcus sp. Es2]